MFKSNAYNIQFVLSIYHPIIYSKKLTGVLQRTLASSILPDIFGPSSSQYTFWVSFQSIWPLTIEGVPIRPRSHTNSYFYKRSYVVVGRTRINNLGRLSFSRIRILPKTPTSYLIVLYDIIELSRICFLETSRTSSYSA